jgi:hypothetical protein
MKRFQDPTERIHPLLHFHRRTESQKRSRRSVRLKCSLLGQGVYAAATGGGARKRSRDRQDKCIQLDWLLTTKPSYNRAHLPTK